MWKIHHKLLSPAFSQQVLNTYLNEMDVQGQNLVSQLATVAEKGPVNITDFLFKHVLRTVSRTSLRLDAKDQDMIDNDYVEAVEEIGNIIIHRALSPLLHLSFLFNRTAMKRRQVELSRDNRKLLDPIIQKRKSDLKSTKHTVNNNKEYSVPGKFKPILDLLLHLSDEQYALSDDEIRAHLNTFVAASFDTTSSVLQTVLLALGSYPDVQERVFNEIQDIFENREEVIKHDLAKLVYLEAVIKEVLRVYNVVPMIARKLDKDIVLPKYTLRAGSSCILSIYGLHRHSSWGPDAKEFKPERWLNPETLPTNPNVYSPFGIGKRICIGRQYAMMSMKTSLIHIVRNFHISGDISSLKWNFEVVLKAKNPLITLTLRS
ncbi:cytochrome P450 4C1-like [Spodoptera litura]|uniref:Cytochrome P450 4C1-like n=1 Tax=Spodoptera litura TaxID=69820 RepID=A0A9J7EA44_SPOLT|nr:cytochrome P450 4C1-like [Spodoptera litura]